MRRGVNRLRVIFSRRMLLRALALLLVWGGARAEAATLYDRLGGKPGVAAVVDELTRRASADPRIKGRFVDVDVARFKSGLADFLCAQTGGGCSYAGADLRAAHAGMQIVEAEWTAFLEDLDGALAKVNPPEKQELLNLMRSHQTMIVQSPPPEALKADGDLVDKAKQLALMLKNVGKLKQAELLDQAVQ